MRFSFYLQTGRGDIICLLSFRGVNRSLQMCTPKRRVTFETGKRVQKCKNTLFSFLKERYCSERPRVIFREGSKNGRILFNSPSIYVTQGPFLSGKYSAFLMLRF